MLVLLSGTMIAIAVVIWSLLPFTSNFTRVVVSRGLTAGLALPPNPGGSTPDRPCRRYNWLT